MRTLQMIDGDLVLVQGTFVTIDEDEELRQSTAEGLRTALGEWFLDEEFGLDREPITGKGFDQNESTDAIIECVTQDPRIERVENITFTFDRPARVLRVDMQLVKTDETTLEVEVTV